MYFCIIEKTAQGWKVRNFMVDSVIKSGTETNTTNVYTRLRLM